MSCDLGEHLLNLAAAPEVRIAAVLDAALCALAGEARADAAALLLLDPAEMQASLVHGAVWGEAEASAEALFERCRDRIADPRCAAGAPPPAALNAEHRSSVWLPLVEHRRPVGLLALSSRLPEAFPAARIEPLGAAAQSALPGLQRALLRHWLAKAGAPADVVGRSPAFLELERQIRRAGSFADGAVLVTGERGSGKELVAWAIHAWSRRRSRPFVPLLGAACAETMTADELFGHERSSFTGAAQARMGKFQLADGGTLLLDEAGDLPPAAQAAILRVLERGELQRIGRDETLRVNVRVVAATNRDLAAFMADGRFRHDLYDRLSFFEIRVPPLRERTEDVPLLARHFLRSACAQTWRASVLRQEGVCGTCAQAPASGCASAGFFAALQAYAWPGNVRELRQMMGRLVATAPDEVLDLRHLPEGVRAAHRPCAPAADDGWSLDTAVRRHIEKVLQHTKDNQSEAARLLGLPLSTMRSKMKRLGMDPQRRI
jgi:DNA-binding NtrC family response regulator